MGPTRNRLRAGHGRRAGGRPRGARRGGRARRARGRVDAGRSRAGPARRLRAAKLPPPRRRRRAGGRDARAAPRRGSVRRRAGRRPLRARLDVQGRLPALIELARRGAGRGRRATMPARHGSWPSGPGIRLMEADVTGGARRRPRGAGEGRAGRRSCSARRTRSRGSGRRRRGQPTSPPGCSSGAPRSRSVSGSRSSTTRQPAPLRWLDCCCVWVRSIGPARIFEETRARGSRREATRRRGPCSSCTLAVLEWLAGRCERALDHSGRAQEPAWS